MQSGSSRHDGLLGFELGKYFDGEVGRYLRMMGTQLGCCAGAIKATSESGAPKRHPPLPRQRDVVLHNLTTLSILKIAHQGAQAG